MILLEGAQRAAEALSVERSSAVRRALLELRAAVEREETTRNEAAGEIVRLVEDFGLLPVTLDNLPEEITEDDLAVVCWPAVLPAASARQNA